MRMAHFQPEQRVLMVAAKWWADQVTARTGGRIVIKHYFSEKLATATEILPLVGRGGIELGTPTITYHISEFPLNNFLGDYPWPIMDEFVLWPRLIAEIPALAAEWKKNNVVPLSYGAVPPYGIVLRKPIKTVDELKNFKIRVWGTNVPMKMIKLGMVPVSLSSAETYEGIEKGTVDASLAPMDQHRSLGLWQVAKYHLKCDILPVGGFAAAPVMNLDAFNRLDPELRKILTDLQVDHLNKVTQLVKEADAADETFLKNHGVNVLSLPEAENRRFQKVSMEVWEQEAADLSARGLGAEVSAIKAGVEKVRAKYLKTRR
jgi:TRAP-type C4-dicarboxylate transport system substrate-binding protein